MTDLRSDATDLMLPRHHGSFGTGWSKLG